MLNVAERNILAESEMICKYKRQQVLHLDGYS
jgi:hypothetical protein